MPPQLPMANQKLSYNLLAELNMEEGCHVSQDESSHIQEGRGSMYATDIACFHRRFDVKAPNFADEYKIVRVDKNVPLGTYVVLQYGAYSLVYGHTETVYKVGDIVTKGTVIGRINKTGITTGPHVHIEKWKGNDNITFDHKKINKYSMLLLEQRGRLPTQASITRTAMQIIKKYECGGGAKLNAYWDYNGWTIGCGTRSYEGESITANEAERRLSVIVMSLSDKVMKDFPGLSTNKYAALVSLGFNCHTGYEWLKNNGINEEDFKGCNKADGKVLRGLEKRRDEEWKLFNS